MDQILCNIHQYLGEPPCPFCANGDYALLAEVREKISKEYIHARQEEKNEYADGLHKSIFIIDAIKRKHFS